MFMKIRKNTGAISATKLLVPRYGQEYTSNLSMEAKEMPNVASQYCVSRLVRSIARRLKHFELITASYASVTLKQNFKINF